MSDITSLAVWRQNPQLVGWAFKVFNSPEWKLLNQIMQESEHVRLYPADVEALQKLGRIEGWDLYNSMQKTAALPIAAQGEMPAVSFEPPELPDLPKAEEPSDEAPKRKK